ncbi:hypothetical protein VTJ83DRAFT_5931 [Remersonia thermophila]|uniref:Uncharacterized protein n=1 Tax=Remersonia thermophila TaxID=72144 RepID=A0ABR4DAF4_9PEZI
METIPRTSLQLDDLPTMERQHTRPALFSKAQSKYGRCDYKRFDSIASTHMRAGRGTIGKVEIDCRFLFTRSQWGVIGEMKNPAGIMYLDLDFSQPPDCKLESATVTITLTEDDGVEKRSACPVKFTDYFGPRSLRGEESVVQTRRTKNRTPEVHLLGYGAGGIGLDEEKVVQTKGRWDFSGYISSTKDDLWYNQLRWELKESSLEVQPTHNNLFRTAFTLEHNATRFYMTVQVSGKLARFSDKVRNRFKFGEKRSKDEEIVTKIEWSEEYSCPTRLDIWARGLDNTMRLANRVQIADEMPSAMAASYYPSLPAQNYATLPQPIPSIHPPPQAVHLVPPPPLITLQTAPQQSMLGPWLASTLPPAHEGGLSTVVNPLHHLPPLTIDDLRMAATGHAPADPPQQPRPPGLLTPLTAETAVSEVSVGSTSVTLVNPVTPGDETPGNRIPDTVAKDEDPDKELDKVPDAGKSLVPDGLWLGIAAMLLEWFGTVRLLLWELVRVVGGPLGTTTLEARQNPIKAGRKHKAVEFDRVAENGHLRTPKTPRTPLYPVQTRFRRRRTPRYGKRRALSGWNDEVRHESSSL